MFDIFPTRRRIPFPVAGFSPLSLSPALWLKADAGTFQTSGGSPATTDGDPVGEWQDQSGNGRHCSQASGTKRPTFKVNIQNGLPAILGDRSDDVLTFGNVFGGLTAAEMFSVLRSFSDTDAVGGGYGFFGQNGITSTHYPWSSGDVYDGFASTTRQSTGNPTPSIAAWHLYNVVSAPGEWTSRINGVQHSTTATNTVGWSTNPSLFDGTDNNGAGGGYAYYYIGEVLIFGSVLSSGNRASIKSYLDSRWGL